MTRKFIIEDQHRAGLKVSAAGIAWGPDAPHRAS